MTYRQLRDDPKLMDEIIIKPFSRGYMQGLKGSGLTPTKKKRMLKKALENFK